MTNTSPTTDPELEALLTDAARGDDQAIRRLLERHQTRLQRMIAARLDRRLAPRLDPSDVVQETLADAARRLPNYLRDRPLPFYPWLFRLAADWVARTHRHHVASTVRGVWREESIGEPSLDEATFRRWGQRLRADDMSPERCMAREELRDLLAGAIERMEEAERQVLGLRYLDGLPFEKIAAILEVGLSAVKMRHLRALERLRVLLREVGVDASDSS